MSVRVERRSILTRVKVTDGGFLTLLTLISDMVASKF